MKNQAGNTILFKLVPIQEMQIHIDNQGNEKNTGTTAEVMQGNTNQVKFVVVVLGNGKEYHIFNGTI